MAEPDDDRAEQAFRDALREHADEADFRPLTISNAKARPQPSALRWVPAAAAVVIALLLAPLLINQPGSPSSVGVPADANAPERVPAQATAASAAGVRWESHRTLSYQVPSSWGYGEAPGPDWCAGSDPAPTYGAFVELSPERLSVRIGCARELPESRLRMHVSVRAVDAADRGWDLPSGWTLTAAEPVDGYRLEVVHPVDESAVAGRIVASVRPIGQVDPNGCPATAPAVAEDVEGQFTSSGVDSVSLCQYDLDRGRQLLASKSVAAPAAQQLARALEAAPAGSGPDEACNRSGDTDAFVRLWSGSLARDVRVRYSGCRDNGLTGLGEPRQLTGDVCANVLVAPLVFRQGRDRAAALCRLPQPSAGPTTSPAPEPTKSE